MPKRKRRKPQTRFTAAELLAAELPEPRCVVEGIVTEGPNLLVGRPKQGKSWLALSISLGIAGGTGVLGNVGADTGDVLYLMAANGEVKAAGRGLYVPVTSVT